MSAIADIKRVCEREILTLNQPVAFEGVSFDPPSGLYIRTQFVINSPDDPVIGDKYYRERVQFQVFVSDILNVGTGNAISVAESVRSLFPKGRKFDENGTNVYVLRTPQVSSTLVFSDRVVLPVMINLVGEVFED
jgi:hypothetical protein